MFYHLLYPLYEHISAFRLFRYITLRTAYASVTALALSLLLGPALIRGLRRFQIGQTIREEGPQSHQKKSGTPTMGGILILIATGLPTLLWADLSNRFIWIVLFATLGAGAVGFLDDLLKLRRGKNLGLRARHKLLGQSVVGLAVGVYLYFYPATPELGSALPVPIFKDVVIPLGPVSILFAAFLITGFSNAVNLTDGLDGLAIGPTIVAAAAFALLAYIAGHRVAADYLQIPPVREAGELAVFCGALMGAGMGFLWFNCHPAEVFMGDVGSLAIGAALSCVALLVRQEILLVIICGVFVLETVSVILQVASFKLTGKRLFKMAPLHHHFEAHERDIPSYFAGHNWPESKVIVRFWLLSVLCALLALSTLKIR
jgi:phospho-N-acetylmuramoyl-pentapeptide-transferase